MTTALTVFSDFPQIFFVAYLATFSASEDSLAQMTKSLKNYELEAGRKPGLIKFYSGISLKVLKNTRKTLVRISCCFGQD